MAYSFIQAAQVANNGSTSSASTAAFGGSVSASGIFAYFAFYYHGSAAQTAVVTRSTDVFTEVGAFRDAGSGYGCRWGYGKSLNTGTTPALVTFGAAVDIWGLNVIEYSGLDLTTPYVATESAGQYMGGPGSGTDAFTSGNATPGYQPAAVISQGVNANSFTIASGTGFTDRGANFNFGFGGSQGRYEDKRITSLSAVAGTFTVGAADFGTVAMIILREAATPVSFPVGQACL